MDSLTIVGFIGLLFIIYCGEKLIWRPRNKDKWKKISISYYFDKYILKIEPTTWGSYDED